MAENTNNDSSVQVDEKMIIDDIQKALKFEFTRDILIKPLPVEYVEKEITEPVATGKKDKDGVDMKEDANELVNDDWIAELKKIAKNYSN